jgi:hypothetical protein
MASKRKKLKAKPTKRTKSRDAEMKKINEYLDSVKLPKKITKDKMAEMANKLEKPKRKSPKRKSPKRKSTDVGMKIRKLMKEGYPHKQAVAIAPHKQAVAIALSMKNSNKLGPRGGYKKSPKKSKRKSPKKSKRKSPKKSKRKSPKKSKRKKSKRKSSKKSKRKSSKKSKRKSPKKRR